MTKTEFRDQFKRLRVCGYRLPVFTDATIDDVLTEWYATFKDCSGQEFSEAIDRLKREKTDTFWPATGELWAQIADVRKARRIRLQSRESGHGGPEMSDEMRQEFLKDFREFKERMLGKSMPDAAPQVAPEESA